MFNIGDLVIYSGQGICCIDDICEKTYWDVTKDYYVLHPIENSKLTINIPVDNDKVVMLGLIDRNEAEEIINSFRLPGISWIEIYNQRTQKYLEIVKKGDRKEISKIINTLMREKYRAELRGAKFYKQDDALLEFTQNTLFKELAMSLNTTYEAIYEKVSSLIAISEV
ncbi:CarD family transcriptional regulator [Clostridium sp. A1-XYC3]|uniref:CarD family transcriptional regulator n=1 Tax=Clostridium tanneri TaxID=3037988 RepID=A0ABU4JP81_9CLOT|nr:CarD family transcriptional regulator [Clostridium sp. A1-XYC3]MDW8799967.1 CarD family transcriptional regulator [Clostridium sp. A1-XYC3]